MLNEDFKKTGAAVKTRSNVMALVVITVVVAVIIGGILVFGGALALQAKSARVDFSDYEEKDSQIKIEDGKLISDLGEYYKYEDNFSGFNLKNLSGKVCGSDLCEETLGSRINNIIVDSLGGDVSKVINDKGQYDDLVYRVLGNGGSELSETNDDYVKWESSNKEVAVVEPGGKVQFISWGETNIRAYYGDGVSSDIITLSLTEDRFNKLDLSDVMPRLDGGLIVSNRVVDLQDGSYIVKAKIKQGVQDGVNYYLSNNDGESWYLAEDSREVRFSGKDGKLKWAAKFNYDGGEVARIQRGGVDDDLKEQKVVFLGASITDKWPLEEVFPEYDFQKVIEYGVQRKVREFGRVIRQSPKIVTIKFCSYYFMDDYEELLNGVDYEQAIKDMVDEATANDVIPILATTIPVNLSDDFGEAFNRTQLQNERIREFNDFIKNYAQEKDLQVLDYYSWLVDDAGQELKYEFAEASGGLGGDGLHINDKAYEVINGNILSVLQDALDNSFFEPGPDGDIEFYEEGESVVSGMIFNYQETKKVYARSVSGIFTEEEDDNCWWPLGWGLGVSGVSGKISDELRYNELKGWGSGLTHFGMNVERRVNDEVCKIASGKIGVMILPQSKEVNELEVEYYIASDVVPSENVGEDGEKKQQEETKQDFGQEKWIDVDDQIIDEKLEGKGVKFKFLKTPRKKYRLQVKRIKKYPKKISKKKSLGYYDRIKTTLNRIKKKKAFKLRAKFYYSDDDVARLGAKEKKLRLKCYSPKLKKWKKIKARHNIKKNYFKMIFRNFKRRKNFYAIIFR